MKFAFVAAEKATGEFKVTQLCKALRVSPSGFYAWCKREPSDRSKKDEQLKVLIKASFDASRKTYGSPRVLEDLRDDHDQKVGRNRVIRLMQEEGLRARPRKRFKCTTMSEHDQPVAPNLLNQEFEADAPNQRWVGDTTELVVDGGRLFLAAIVDLFSRFVVGWALSTVNDRHLTIRALEMAIRRRCPQAGLLHHSDQGSTYAAEDYQDILVEHRITCSMSRRGNCLDNAAMESWFSTFKAELGERFATPAQAKESSFDYIEVFYNQRRRHSSLGYVSPAEFERRYYDAQISAAA